MNYKKKIKKLLDINAYRSLNRFTIGHRRRIGHLTLLNITNSFTSIAIAFISKQLIDNAILGQTSIAIIFGLAFAFFLLLQLALTSFISFTSVRIQETMRNQLQLSLLEKIYNKSWLSISQYKTGDLLTRVYNDVNSIVNASTVIIPTLIALLLQLIAAFSLLAYYDTLLATITFLVSPITIFASMYIGRKLKRLQHLIQNADSSLRSMINESLQNQIILKTYNYLPNNLSKIDSLQEKKFKILRQRNLLSIKANLMLGLGYRFAFFGAIGLGAIRLSTKAISFGTFTAFIQLVGQVQGPIQGLTTSLPQLVSSLSSVERLEELENLEADYLASENIEYTIEPKAINIKALHFHYKKNHPILSDLNLQINKGEKIAIIGSSGEGKTTLIHILLSLIQANEGDVTMTLDDNSVIPIDSNTRKFFSYVPQSNTLFSGSIRDNFLITNDITDEEIDLALKASCSSEFISNLEDGIDTLISERGIGLSEGQAQRITIARALLHKAPFLVFDEATSALDLETEKELISNIKNFYVTTTLITVTHRESFLSICDKVYRLESGILNQIVYK